MSGGGLSALCPAKVNLALRVLRRRDDGYHELDTIFQAIDLWDRLEIAPGHGLSLTCNDPRVPTDDRNLVLRAAAAVAVRAGGGPRGAVFHLHKRIPSEAGLGGGSSDAAGAIRLAAEWWGIELDADEERHLARELGADVPFFLQGGTARGTGRGDLIERLPSVGIIPLLLGVPPFGVSTAEAFGALSARLTLPANGVSLPLFSGPKWPKKKDFSFMVNDFERVVFTLRPELGQFRDGLIECGAVGALMSGSGSSVFGVFAREVDRDAAVERLSGRFRGWSIQGTRTVEGAAHVVRVGDDEQGSQLR